MSYRFFSTFFSLVLCAHVVSCQIKPMPMPMSDSFERRDFIRNWLGSEKCCDYSIQQSDSVVKSGKYSLRFELRRSDRTILNTKRAELKLSAEKTPNVDRWFRVSYFLPNGYAKDPMAEILAQWHEVPDRKLGETYRTPPLSLILQNDSWKFRVWWATDRVNTNKTVSGKKMFDLGKFETGKWTDWVFHLYFSHKEDGIVQIWKNGKLVVDYKGPNYYNDQIGPYFKVGIYKSGWNNKSRRTGINQRIFYIDDIRIGNESYDLNKMSVKF